MTTINMLQAKTNLSKLVDAVESGAEAEIIIARNGKPAVRIVPLKPATSNVRVGLFDGKYPDFSLEDFNAWDAQVEHLFTEADGAADESAA